MRLRSAKASRTTLAITGGFLDAVVHNAGVAAGGAFEDIPDAELRRVMDTNLFGVMALTRALLPTFRKQRSGRIVVVSSEAGLQRPAVQFDLRRVEVGGRGLGGIARLRGRAVRHRGAARRARARTSPTSGRPRRASPRRTAPTGGGARTCSAPATRTSPPRAAIRKWSRRRSPTCWRPSGRASAIRSAAWPATRHFARGKIPSRWLRRGVEAYLGLRRVRL